MCLMCGGLRTISGVVLRFHFEAGSLCQLLCIPGQLAWELQGFSYLPQKHWNYSQVLTWPCAAWGLVISCFQCKLFTFPISLALLCPFGTHSKFLQIQVKFTRQDEPLSCEQLRDIYFFCCGHHLCLLPRPHEEVLFSPLTGPVSIVGACLFWTLRSVHVAYESALHSLPLTSSPL